MTKEHLEEIQGHCRNLNIRTIFKSFNTIRNFLTKVKTPQPTHKKVKLVHEIRCQNCDKVYIGETGRSLQKRISEHKMAVKRGDRNNDIAVAWDSQHQITQEGATVEEKDFGSHSHYEPQD